MKASLSRNVRRFFALAALLCFGACQQPVEFKPGQVWSYDNRSGEGASTIQILHIEKATPIGDVYFVSVRALDVRRLGRKIRSTEVWPLVFTREALTSSLRNHQWDQPVDRPYLKQLDRWQRDAREGKAIHRTFSVPVKEALDQIHTDHPDSEKRIFGDTFA